MAFGCRVEGEGEAQASSASSVGIVQSHTCQNFGAICFGCKFSLNHIICDDWVEWDFMYLYSGIYSYNSLCLCLAMEERHAVVYGLEYNWVVWLTLPDQTINMMQFFPSWSRELSHVIDCIHYGSGRVPDSVGDICWVVGYWWTLDLYID